jgi:MFS transporter, DHA1 family, multidrug resistance protein
MSTQPPQPGAAAVPAARSSRHLLLVLAGLSALATLSTNILLPVLPQMAQSLAASETAANATLSVFLAVFALAQLVVGPWSDRVGRRRVVIAGLGVFLLGSLLCAVATRLDVLLAARAVQALGAAAASVLARAIARDLFAGPALARLLGLIMVVMAAAPGFSPLLGSLAGHWLGWRAVFVLIALLGLALGAAYLLLVGETLPAQRRVARAPREVGTEYGLLLRDRRFVAPALVVALVSAGLFAFFAATPAILRQRYALDTLQIGLFFASVVFVVFAAGLLAPRLAQRFGAGRVLGSGLLLIFTAGALAWAGGQQAQTTLPHYLAAVSLFLFGMGLASPLASAAALTPFANAAGQASALLGFLQMAGAALGTGLVTAPLGMDRMGTLGLVMMSAALLSALPGRIAIPRFGTASRLAGNEQK